MTGEFKHYNPRVEHHVSVLLKVLHKSVGKEVNFSKIMDNLVFDMLVISCLIAQLTANVELE